MKTLRRYHTVTIQAGDQTITAADPLPDDAQQALTRLRDAAAATLIWHKSGRTNSDHGKRQRVWQSPQR